MWVRKQDTPALFQQPRKLTYEEIEDIISSLPRPQGADHYAASVAAEDIARLVKQQLLSAIISPDALGDFKKQMIDYFERSRAQPGSTVGLTSAEAIGALISQMALKSFHTSGSAKNMSGGIGATNEILSCSKNRKVNSMRVSFANKNLTAQDVLNLRPLIIGATISRLVKDIDIDTPANVVDRKRDYWVDIYDDLYLRPDNKSIPVSDSVMRLYLKKDELERLNIRPEDIINALDSQETPKPILCIPSPIGEGIIDIYPDTRSVKGSLVGTLDQPVTLSVGKSKEGIQNESLGYSSDQVFLVSVIRPLLDNVRVKGVAGVIDLYPVAEPVLSVITEEHAPDTTTLRKMQEMGIFDLIGPVRMSCVYFNKIRMDLNDISKSKIINFLSTSGFSDIYQMVIYNIITPNGWTYAKSESLAPYISKLSDTDKLRVGSTVHEHYILTIRPGALDKIKTIDFIRMLMLANLYPEGAIVSNTILVRSTNGINPSNNIGNTTWDNSCFMVVLGQGQSEVLPVLRAKMSKTKEILKDPTGPNEKFVDYANRLYRAGNIVYANTIGTNMKDILSLPEIDANNTYCNNSVEIAKTLGIEAALKFITSDLNSVIRASDSTINPRNAILIAEVMCSQGYPFGFTYPGISRQGKQGLSHLSTLAAQGKTFKEAALFGSRENITSVSASIIMGQPMMSGTGIVDLVVTPEYKQRWEEEKRKPVMLDNRTVKDLLGNTGPVGMEATLADLNLTAQELSESIANPVRFNEGQAEMISSKENITDLSTETGIFPQATGSLPSYNQSVVDVKGVTTVNMPKVTVISNELKTAIDLTKPVTESWSVIILKTAAELPKDLYIDYKSLCVTPESRFFSLLPFHIPQVAASYRAILPDNIKSIVDATAHIGVDTLNFANIFPTAKITSIEIESKAQGCLVNNTRNIRDRVEVIAGSFIDWGRKGISPNIDLLYFDPPWGVEYVKHKENKTKQSLFLGGYSVSDLVKSSLSSGIKTVVLKVPITFDYKTVEGLDYTKVDIVKDYKPVLTEDDVYYSILFFGQRKIKDRVWSNKTVPQPLPQGPVRTVVSRRQIIRK